MEEDEDATYKKWNYFTMNMTMNAVYQRLKRRLVCENKVLHKARGAYWKGFMGDYYTMGLISGAVIDCRIDIVALAHRYNLLTGVSQVEGYGPVLPTADDVAQPQSKEA